MIERIAELENAVKMLRITRLQDAEHIMKLQYELSEWKELFFLLKNDHEKLENFQTNEWMVKARKMGLKV